MTLVLIAAALIAGTIIGARRTRAAVRTTEGRRRHKLDRRQVITGEIALDPHAEMTAALRAAQAAQTTFSLPAGPAPAHPETVAIPRIDGSRPTRPPVPRIDGGQPPRRYPEWSTRG